MGYDLNIVRKNDWGNDEEQSSISLIEWLEYAKDDTELKETDVEGDFDWIAYPHIEDDGIPCFEYYSGMISTKNPNYWIIKKLLDISQKLHAKVQGEGGEFYDEEFLKLIS